MGKRNFRLYDMVDAIPEAYPLTRAVVQSKFFIDKKLCYDANIFIKISLITFPNSEALHQLLAGVN